MCGLWLVVGCEYCGVFWAFVYASSSSSPSHFSAPNAKIFSKLFRLVPLTPCLWSLQPPTPVQASSHRVAQEVKSKESCPGNVKDSWVNVRELFVFQFFCLCFPLTSSSHVPSTIKASPTSAGLCALAIVEVRP